MPDLAPKERLQPSLLDRLTDDEPERQVESRDKRVLSLDRLMAGVRRDLSWLFNTSHLASAQDLSAFPEAAASTINYGLPDLAGRTASSIVGPMLENLVRRAIWQFEPRLRKNSVHVRIARTPDGYSHNAVVMTIDAELWAQPTPVRLLLRTDLDLESGEVHVTEAGPG